MRSESIFLKGIRGVRDPQVEHAEYRQTVRFASEKLTSETAIGQQIEELYAA